MSPLEMNSGIYCVVLHIEVSDMYEAKSNFILISSLYWQRNEERGM